MVSGRRPWTYTVWPAFFRLIAMGLPMIPMPMASPIALALNFHALSAVGDELGDERIFLGGREAVARVRQIDLAFVRRACQRHACMPTRLQRLGEMQKLPRKVLMHKKDIQRAQVTR